MILAESDQAALELSRQLGLPILDLRFIKGDLMTGMFNFLVGEPEVVLLLPIHLKFRLSVAEYWALEGWLLARGAVEGIFDGLYRKHSLRGFSGIWERDVSEIKGDHEGGLSEVSFPRLGHPRPKYWLVGERHNRPVPPFQTTVFYPQGPTSCGEYLRLAMKLAGLTWENTLLSNAIDDEGMIVTREDWQALGEPRVLALGRASDKTLGAQGVPHRVTYHPQFWRRFHHHSLDKYVEKLQEVMG